MRLFFKAPLSPPKCSSPSPLDCHQYPHQFRDQLDWVYSLETEIEIYFHWVSISRPRLRLFSCSLNNETETETFFSESQLRDRDFFFQVSRLRLRLRLPLVSKSRPRLRLFRDSRTPLEFSLLSFMQVQNGQYKMGLLAPKNYLHPPFLWAFSVPSLARFYTCSDKM